MRWNQCKSHTIISFRKQIIERLSCKGKKELRHLSWLSRSNRHHWTVTTIEPCIVFFAYFFPFSLPFYSIMKIEIIALICFILSLEDGYSFIKFISILYSCIIFFSIFQFDDDPHYVNSSNVSIIIYFYHISFYFFIFFSFFLIISRILGECNRLE